MSVAIRAITRIQDADDFGSTPGAGNDGYAIAVVLKEHDCDLIATPFITADGRINAQVQVIAK